MRVAFMDFMLRKTTGIQTLFFAEIFTLHKLKIPINSTD
jgi:hypothetical protein